MARAMPQLLHARTLAGGRLARRLFALFVAAALLPLALSDWVSTRAVSDVAEELHQRGHERSTRLVSRSVLDRLITAHDLLLALPETRDVPDSVPGLGTVFRTVSLHGADAGMRWRLAASHAADDPPVRLPPDADTALSEATPTVRLWVDPTPAPRPRLLMRAYADGRLRWQAELEPQHLWGPILVDNPDTHWLVRSGSGRTLLAHRGGDDLPTETGHSEDAAQLKGQRVAVAQLPLAGLFVTGQWVFEQRGAREPVRWRGAELSVWLLGLASLTVLTAALVAHWRIRRLFEPLEDLTAGTRRLAAGDTGARVSVPGQDELGALAVSFNDMAQRIDDQLSALRAMALIDHDILDGQPLERIADHAVRQLAAWLPDTAIVLSWCDDDKLMHSCRAETTSASAAAATAAMSTTSETRTAAGIVDGTTAAGRATGGATRRASPGDAAAQVLLSSAHLNAQDALAYAAIDQDARLAADAMAAAPWLPAGRRAPRQVLGVRDVHAAQADHGVQCHPGADEHLSLLPIRGSGGTLALLALRYSMAPDAQRLQPARELRDRLAVAMAARARERELLHRALHDSLTGLANRDGLQLRLDQWLEPMQGPLHPQTPGLAQGDNSQKTLALLMVDLDHFKDINDSLGHGVGDQVLRVCAERLSACAPPPAVVARLGGDEFVLLLPGAGADEALAVGERLLKRLSQPLQLQGCDCVLGASVGIALAPMHGQTALELLRRADIALYAAKREGRGGQSLFAGAMDNAVFDRMQLQHELRQAIDRKEFVLHYQPRVRADNGAVTSAEALVRWQHPSRGLLPPGAFIEQTETAGLMDALGALVLEEACRQAATWHRQGLGLHRVSVNVSTQQLKSGQLPTLVRRTLARHHLPADMLELEVTESLLVHDANGARRQLMALREAGVTIALDDFGTGYSSMTMLRQLPIDVMKIDRAFVADLDTDDSALAITRAIVSLAETMGLRVVAEGVETEGHATRLRQMGCHELQGYYYARPLPAAALEEHVRKQSSGHAHDLHVLRPSPVPATPP
jgi:diguanylate cyclase (GGDEF)-like protein